MHTLARAIILCGRGSVKVLWTTRERVVQRESHVRDVILHMKPVLSEDGNVLSEDSNEALDEQRKILYGAGQSYYTLGHWI